MIGRKVNLLLFFQAIFVLAACSAPAEQPVLGSPISDEKLQVVATTTIVGDVLSRVGGDLIEFSVLLPVGTDPHGFDPTPQDISKIAEADLVVANGIGLEDFLDNLIESAGAQDKVVYISDGIDILMFEDDGHENEPTKADPHIWTDPKNVMVWVTNLEGELSKLDPENAESYAVNAEGYQIELQALDAWIREQVALIPSDNRKLVTDHTLFGYFAEAYGLEQVGALIPGYSTLAEPTANELADIQDTIHELEVKAIFVGNTVNPALAERVTEDTGTQLVFVYTGSLSEPDGEASTYIEYMRYNTSAFVNALIP